MVTLVEEQLIICNIGASRTLSRVWRRLAPSKTGTEKMLLVRLEVPRWTRTSHRQLTVQRLIFILWWLIKHTLGLSPYIGVCPRSLLALSTKQTVQGWHSVKFAGHQMTNSTRNMQQYSSGQAISQQCCCRYVTQQWTRQAWYRPWIVESRSTSKLSDIDGVTGCI